jgi:archaellum component FlaC
MPRDLRSSAKRHTDAFASQQDPYVKTLKKRLEELERIVEQQGKDIQQLQSLVPSLVNKRQR